MELKWVGVCSRLGMDWCRSGIEVDWGGVHGIDLLGGFGPLGCSAWEHWIVDTPCVGCRSSLNFACGDSCDSYSLWKHLSAFRNVCCSWLVHWHVREDRLLPRCNC